MSLKAKLEAVIYAAEEPVTLAQLAALFADDAFLWKAEREALENEAAEALRQAAEAAVEVPADAPAAVELAESGQETGAELTELLLIPEPESGTEAAVEVEISQSASGEVPNAGTVELANQVAEAPATTAEELELEAKRAERKREREVREILRGVLDELIAEYASDSRGIEIREIAGGFRMATKPEIHDAVRAFVKSLKPPMKLSLPALETLAVIAYKQPVTAPEVGEIRGVDSAGVLGSLISRKLIATAGRKQVVGRPMLYKTTKEFLLRFGLKDLSELPSMEEFEKMAAMELSEEPLDAEPDDSEQPSGPVEHSGDLFEEAQVEEPRVEESQVADAESYPSGLTSAEPASSEREKEVAPEAPAPETQQASTPTAEPSPEAAEAQAPVERQDAEEIEAEV